MAGLGGILDTRSDAVSLHRGIDRMQSVLRAPGAVAHAAVATAPGVACLTLRHEGTIARDEDSRTWLVFDGELYDRAPLLRFLGDEAAPIKGDAHLCLRLLLADGDAFVRRLNGQFNLAVYRELDGVLSIATDRFGYRPLFFAHRGSRFVFATAMKAVLAVLDTDLAVDGVGLLQSMRIGWPLGDRTWLEGVRVADPGSWLRVTPAQISQSRYFRFSFEPSRPTPEPREYAEGLADVLRRAVQRRIGREERVAIPLSGGLDSRALLLSTRPGFRPAVAYTFGRAASYDVVFAQELARIAGVPHRHYPYEPGYLARALPAVVWFTEALNAFAEVTFTSVAFHDRIGTEADVLMYGHCGDCLTGAHLPVLEVLRCSRPRLIERLFRQYNRVPEAALRRVFNQEFYQRHRHDLFEAMQLTFVGIEGDRIGDVCDTWDIENRQRRGVFVSNAVDRHRFGVRAPFLDNDVVEYLRRTPISLRLLQIGYKRMLARVFPEAAHVPWAHTGEPLRQTLAGDFIQQALNYARQRLPLRRSDPRLFRDLRADVKDGQFIARVLQDFALHPHFPEDVFDRSGWRGTIDEHLDGRVDLTHLIIMLATFATAWRLFLFETPTTAPAEIVAV